MHQAGTRPKKAPQQGRLLSDSIGTLIRDLDPGRAAEHRPQQRHVVGRGKYGQAAREDVGDRGKQPANIATDAEGPDQPGVERDLMLDLRILGGDDS
jgi:hypothetical protein